ncbi:MAG: WbqC family protein [Bacteroidales bacterium]
MKLAIMQPYFMPYIGYFQLINTVDKFVVYDNIKFTKKGWINRNRILNGSKDEMFSIPIKKDSDYLDIFERSLASDYLEQNKKTLRKIENYYRKAPQFQNVFPLIESVFLYQEHNNLFEFIVNSIQQINNYLEIGTEIIVSSTVNIDHYLKSQAKVIAICQELKASQYINAIGGQDLYKKEDFAIVDIELKFLKTFPIEYKQFNNNFVPWLSIIDILMFNSVDEVNNMLDKFELI